MAQDAVAPVGEAAEEGQVADPQRVLRSLRGDLETLDSVFRKLFESAPVQILEAREAFEEGDVERLERATHRLRGGLLLFGASRTMSVIEALDGCARRGERVEAGPLLERLDEELAAALRYVEGWIERMGRPG